MTTRAYVLQPCSMNCDRSEHCIVSAVRRSAAYVWGALACRQAVTLPLCASAVQIRCTIKHTVCGMVRRNGLAQHATAGWSQLVAGRGSFP